MFSVFLQTRLFTLFLLPFAFFFEPPRLLGNLALWLNGRGALLPSEIFFFHIKWTSSSSRNTAFIVDLDSFSYIFFELKSFYSN